MAVPSLASAMSYCSGAVNPLLDEEVDLAVAGADLDQVEAAVHFDELRERLLGEIGQVAFGLEAALQHPHLVGNVDQEQAARLEHRREHIHRLVGSVRCSSTWEMQTRSKKPANLLRRQLLVLDQREQRVVFEERDELRVHLGDPDLVGDGAQLMAERALRGAVVERRRNLETRLLLEQIGHLAFRLRRDLFPDARRCPARPAARGRNSDSTIRAPGSETNSLCTK